MTNNQPESAYKFLLFFQIKLHQHIVSHEGTQLARSIAMRWYVFRFSYHRVLRILFLLHHIRRWHSCILSSFAKELCAFNGIISRRVEVGYFHVIWGHHWKGDTRFFVRNWCSWIDFSCQTHFTLIMVGLLSIYFYGGINGVINWQSFM